MAYFRKEQIEAGVISEFNFTRGALYSDKELFFGPLTDKDVFSELTEEWLLAHVFARAGVFLSVGEAKRCGWGRSIPSGFSDYFFLGTYPKKTVRVTVLDVR